MTGEAASGVADTAGTDEAGDAAGKSGGVLVMDLGRHNTVLVGHDRYFLLHTGGRVQLVRDLCPHRGGPLSLARRTADDRRLRCPWHGTKVGIAAVCRTSLPMVRSGSEAAVVLPEAARDVPVTAIRRRILANLPPGVPADPTAPLSSFGPDDAADTVGPDVAGPAGGDPADREPIDVVGPGARPADTARAAPQASTGQV